MGQSIDDLSSVTAQGRASLEVSLAGRAYPIEIGSGIAANPEIVSAMVPGASALIVTNETVGPLHAQGLRSALPDVRLGECVLPDGERHKSLATLERIYDAAVEHGCDRDSSIIALGGGVVGDIAGYAAATYMRGIHLVQIPTTLLAQVDASVGGKTGINHPRGKNMIGAFYQPRGVVADTSMLATLPERELRAGIAEVIKYGLLGDRPLFEWLEANMEALCDRDSRTVAAAIERSCQDKATIVAADEREADRRALLNLGHTFAHAIEAGVGYEGWLHGEAVGVGLCLAADLSARLQLLPPAVVDRVVGLVARAGLPTAPPAIGRERMKSLMAHDKKSRDGRVRFILLDGVGKARMVSDVAPRALDAALAVADSTNRSV